MNDYRNNDSRRRRRHRGPHEGARQFRQFQDRRRHGWGMGLYRNRRDGKVAGVAAGLADYWDVAGWVVRLFFVGAFLFTGTLAIWAYVAACVLLSPRPEDRSGRRRERDAYRSSAAAAAPTSANEEAFGPELEYDERYHDYRPRRMFRYSDSASVRLKRARERLDAAVSRVESMETYVTSRRFKLNSELSRL